MGVGLRGQAGGGDVKGGFNVRFCHFAAVIAALGAAFDDDEIGQQIVPLGVESDKIVPYGDGAYLDAAMGGDGGFFINLICGTLFGSGFGVVQ